MSKTKGILKHGVTGKLMVAAFAGFALITAGCGKEKAEAPKAETAPAAEQAAPAGHPPVEQAAPQQPATDHSAIKSQKEVKLSKEVLAKWKEAKIEIADSTTGSKNTLTLKVGSTTDLKGGHKLKLEAFVPDYAIADNHIESRSNEANNPAVLVTVLDGGNTIARGWVFLSFPEFNSFKSDRYSVALLGPSAKKK